MLAQITNARPAASEACPAPANPAVGNLSAQTTNTAHRASLTSCSARCLGGCREAQAVLGCIRPGGHWGKSWGPRELLGRCPRTNADLLGDPLIWPVDNSQLTPLAAELAVAGRGGRPIGTDVP